LIGQIDAFLVAALGATAGTALNAVCLTTTSTTTAVAPSTTTTTSTLIP